MVQSSFGSLVVYLYKYRGRYIAGVIALVGTNLSLQVLPWVSGRFFNDLQTGNLAVPGIWKYVELILAAAVLVGIFRFAWRYFIFGTSRMVEADLRSTLFNHLLKLSAPYYHRNKTGNLMAVATNDLQAVRAIAGEGILMTFDAIFMTLITVAAMVSAIGWKLSGLALLPLPFLAVCAALFGRFMSERSRDVQDAFAKLSDVTHENIAGVRIVKAFSQETFQEHKFEQVAKNYKRRFLRMMRIAGAIEPTIQLLAGMCFALAILFPGRAVLRGEIALGQFVSLTMYIGMLIWPMIAMGWVVNIIQRGLAGFARLQGVLHEQPEITSASEAELPDGGTIQGDIEIRNLSFRYDVKLPLVLDGVSLSIRHGETLGITGRTGSGKSTLVSLLARVFNPPVGTIFVDGVDVLNLPVAGLRAQIAFVPQESFLFSRTVGQNIGFAPGEWETKDVSGAAQTAQVEADILEFLPQGYETMVGERGITLSGGQRQRVGLSRALIKRAPILVLDDCLSAVDTNTEARILSGLRPVMKGHTTLVISHRIAAVKSADQIIVLEDGQVAESGTHEELLARQGWYFRTYQRQQLEESIANVEE